MAAAKICASPITPAFSEIREGFVAKVSIPKMANTKPPSFHLASRRKATFDLSKLGANGAEQFKKYLAALKHDQVFVSCTVAEDAEAKTSTEAKPSNVGGVSPTLSAASTSTTDMTVSIKDQKCLGRLIGRKDTEELLARFDPAQNFSRRPSLTTRSMPDNRNRKQLHQLLERIYGGCLEHNTNVKTNSITIKPVSEAQWQRRAKTSAQATFVPRQVPQNIESGWGSFAMGESGRLTAIKAQGEADARIAEVFAIKRKTFEEAYQEHQLVRKEAPKSDVMQTFKQTSTTKTTNGKLGGPRKLLTVVETKETAEGKIVESVTLPKGVTADESAAKMPVTEKPKRTVLPPHLRKLAASPPPPLEHTAVAIEWVAARLPDPSP